MQTESRSPLSKPGSHASLSTAKLANASPISASGCGTTNAGARLTRRRAGAYFGGQYVEGPPKSERSNRTIALPVAITSELRRHWALIGEERLKLGRHWLDDDRVFPGGGGGPLGATTIRKALNAALKRTGLPHVRVHDLRHTAATMLIAAGGSLLDAQELLGHSTYAFTANTYAHALDEQKRATADRIDRLLQA